MTTNNDNRHIELYKKYRPRNWKQVIGQDKIVNDLKHAVIDNRLADAYLFSGPRGTGKTSVAKILAKAINCEHVVDGEPCNKCAICKSIDNNTNLGVNYISTANNGSVEQIRNIVDQSRRASDVKKPIWILDEIHNLSKPAFDSLLIPLEDENPNSLFIFCTTNINAIPMTITSRVQSRAFKLVPINKLGQLCTWIVKQEGFTISPEDSPKPLDDKKISKHQIIQAIRSGGATTSGGSVRETLSALEAILSTGEVTLNHSAALTNAIYHDRDVVEAFQTIAKAIEHNEDVKTLAQDVLNDTRSLLFLSTGEKSESDTLLFKGNSDVAKSIGKDKLARAFWFLAEAMQTMTWVPDGQPFLELAALKIITLLRK